MSGPIQVAWRPRSPTNRPTGFVRIGSRGLVTLAILAASCAPDPLNPDGSVTDRDYGAVGLDDGHQTAAELPTVDLLVQDDASAGEPDVADWDAECAEVDILEAGPDAEETCSNGMCDPGENPLECPADCPRLTCPNGACEPGESVDVCAADCVPSCGDCACDPGETAATCPLDCGTCGDGWCVAACGEVLVEDFLNCPTDCACVRECDGRACGDDGCGGPCGACLGARCDGVVFFEAQVCQDHQCVVVPGVACAGHDPCFEDGCDPALGCIRSWTDAACDDEDLCTRDDVCFEGQCGGTPVQCDPAQDTSCRKNHCDPATGACVLVAEPDGTLCDNGDVCDGIETCLEGECASGPPPDLDDGNSCTVGRCDPVEGVYQDAVLDGTACDDGSVCNGREVCLLGECAAGAPPDCASPFSCMEGACDPVAGCTLLPTLDGTSCSDGDPCNGEESCLDGACVDSSPVACPTPSTACRVGACHPSEGCVEEPAEDGGPCDDGDPLTDGDACLDGECVPGAAVTLSFLPDTGQITCFDASGDVVACHDRGSSWFGQDGDYQANPMTYTGVEGGVVRDEVTGLLWEQAPSVGPLGRQAAGAYCANLDLGGHAWRLPNRRELVTLVDFGKVAGQQALIDSMFAAAQKAWYWTSDADPTNANRTVRVSFRYGTTATQDNAIEDGYVRCVTGEAPVSEQQLYPVDHEVGVFDPTTGMFWQRVPSGYLTWQAALDYCTRLDSLGHAGWRLPDVKEAATLLQPDRYSPVLDPDYFPGIRAAQVFWTSTTSADPTLRDHAFIVGLGDLGAVSQGRKVDEYQVLCVRPCPCPDPRCCSRCKVRGDGIGCDDGLPDTVRDACHQGICRGEPAGTPEPALPPPFDCQTLDCGNLGVCVRDAHGERCECRPGYNWDGVACAEDPSWVAPQADGCREFDTGMGSVCLTAATVVSVVTESSADPLFGASETDTKRLPDQGMTSIATAAEEAMISPPAGFKIHGQHQSSLCFAHATTAAIELLLGRHYQPLSEAHALDVAFDADQSAIQGATCHGSSTYRFIRMLAKSEEFIVPDGTWDIDYGGSCTATSQQSPRPTDAILLANGVGNVGRDHRLLMGRDGAMDVSGAKRALQAGHPVLVGVPVVAGEEQWRNWIPFVGIETSTWLTPAIDESPWDRRRDSRCGTNQRKLSKCYCDNDEDCHTAGAGKAARCQGKVCVAGDHAVVLVGYDGDSGGRFWFLNSWDAFLDHWGVSRGGFSNGLGTMSDGFLQKFASYAEEVTSARLACADGVCALGSRRCNGNGGVDECVERSDGCRQLVEVQTCRSGREECLSGACVATCQDSCSGGDAGCVDGSHRWECALLDDGDACFDRAEFACAAGEVCDGGKCLPDCRPRWFVGCQGNEVWWFDSCGQPDQLIRSCSATETCSDGACVSNCFPLPNACYNGNVFSFTSCGPKVLVRSCGISGYTGAPYCSADRSEVVRDFATRGCSAGACTSVITHETNACFPDVCVDGACVPGVNPCGDGICTPGVEDCGSCPGDCPCWSASAPYCAATGQCVQCTSDGHCPSGSTCQAGACAAGCHTCGPEGTTRCVPGGRQRCDLVGNCRQWVNAPCGANQACCQGQCVSTLVPPAPILVSPSANVSVTAGTVRFQWQFQGEANRALLNICTSASMTGNCTPREVTATWTYLDVPVTAGTWYWSVRAINACDVSEWSEYAPPRELVVSGPASEVCNGRDDDADGRIDNAGGSQMSCVREVFHFERIGDPDNLRLQWNGTPGGAPAPPSGYKDPAWMATEGRHPSFLLYNESNGIAGLAKLYYCVKDTVPYDNLYTTNWQAECGTYTSKGETNVLGYIFTGNPGTTNSYANWLYDPWYGRPTKPAPLWRLRKPTTNQHQFTAFEPTITEKVGQGWCCERGPSYACSGHWCTTANTNPVGWVLVPR